MQPVKIFSKTLQASGKLYSELFFKLSMVRLCSLLNYYVKLCRLAENFILNYFLNCACLGYVACQTLQHSELFLKLRMLWLCSQNHQTKQVPKKILEKEINQLKQLKTAGYLDTKDQDKIKYIICLYLQKMRQKKTIFLEMLGIF